MSIYVINIKIQIGYDDSWKNSFGSSTSQSTSYINSMLTHIQAYFCHESLGTKIKIQVYIQIYKITKFIKIEKKINKIVDII